MGIITFSFLFILFIILDGMGDCGIYDPTSVHPPFKSRRERIKEKLKQIKSKFTK